MADQGSSSSTAPSSTGNGGQPSSSTQPVIPSGGDGRTIGFHAFGSVEPYDVNGQPDIILRALTPEIRAVSPRSGAVTGGTLIRSATVAPLASRTGTSSSDLRNQAVGR